MGGGLRGPVVIGGSQPGLMRVLDLGLVDIPSLVASGPVTLYTPTLGDLTDLRVVNLSDFVAFDGDLSVRYGFIDPARLLTDPQDDITGDLIATISPGNSFLDVTFSQTAPNTVVFAAPPGCLYKIGLTSGVLNLELPAVGAWQANHSYSLSQAVLDSGGFVQVVTTAGTSGASVPAFNATPGGTTPEGPDTLVWTNAGAAPTVGSIHFYLCVATPVAP